MRYFVLTALKWRHIPWHIKTKVRSKCQQARENKKNKTKRTCKNSTYVNRASTDNLIKMTVFYAQTRELQSTPVCLRQNNHLKPLLAWKQPSFRPGKIGSISAMFFAKAARDF